MNNQYKYSGRPLTPLIAQELIQELFEGQTVQKQEIANTVNNAHLERGGLASEDPVTTALSAMKVSGLAENSESDFWSIISQTEDRIRISTLDEFTRWAAQFDSGEGSEQYLFRGVSSTDYKIDASAYRRIKKGRNSNDQQDGDFEKFLQINRDLIIDARFRGHDRKNGRKLEDLEVLAEFQHYGAATFLMDFTYNALVALWFACKKSSGNVPKDGKVVAVPPNDPKFTDQTGEFSIITLDSLEEDIHKLTLDNKRLYQWQPRQQQNERIIAQQSIFLFGVLEIGINPDEECLIDRNSKKNIRESLRRIYGITEDMLFPDFDGFARQHSQNVPYTQLSAAEYHQRAYEAHQRGEYEEAILNYNEVIGRAPNDATAYYNRGTANYHLGQHETAINDFDQTIQMNPNHARAHNNRGLANNNLGEYETAIVDFSKAIRLEPSNEHFYCHRGLANNNLGEYETAIADFSEAIRLNPDEAHFYYNRGLANFHLGQHEAAIDDYDEAHQSPYYALKQYLERYESAIDDYDQTIRLSPDYAEAYYHRGLAKQSLEQYEAAIKDYDDAIRINSDYAEAYYQRAEANSFLETLVEAKADLQIALQLAEQSDDANLMKRIDDLFYEIDSRTVGGSEDE